MCGIAGIIGSHSAHLLDLFDGALKHRGPDGRGDHVAGNVAMMQRRLAIIDLKGGDQPLYSNNDQKRALIGNGEIYNYIELRKALDGFPFRTLSRLQVPLALYGRDGVSFPHHLRGMYALAIHDLVGRRLILSRDPFGIKQLYYAETSGSIAFASEAQALIAAGIAEPNLRSDKRLELLQLHFTLGAQTIFPAIHRLLPGETLIIEDGRIISRKQEPAYGIQPSPELIPLSEALKKLDHVLEETIHIHQRSDVPYAMFLSGGIDSSAILAMMARLNPQPVTAFTAGFPDTTVTDERPLASAVAKACKAEIIEVPVRSQDFWNHLPEIVAAMDDPVCDYAIIPTWLLARSARQHGFKVVLSGEGGDEIFAGYGRYRSALRSWPFKKSMRSRGVFDGLGLLHPHYEQDRNWQREFRDSEAKFSKRDLTSLQKLQATDCMDWLPHDLLIKLDRCLMAHGVEGRTPFLDREIASFAFNLPDKLKINQGMGKWLLRHWLEQHLPIAQPFSRKRGFTVPVGAWMLEQGKKLGDAMARQVAIAEIARVDAVRRLYTEPRLATDSRLAHAAWGLLFYALWHRRHIQGLTPEGGILDCLS
ncbi:MAG: asparagine synthase (glutamine-hydrolyzing) [Alphaproteobacteria bacterium]